MSEMPEEQEGTPVSSPPEAPSDEASLTGGEPLPSVPSAPSSTEEVAVDTDSVSEQAASGASPDQDEPEQHQPDSEEIVPNPIIAMRAIRIEESKMRSPSAPTIEAGEATYEEVAEGLDEEARALLAHSPVPADLHPAEEVAFSEDIAADEEEAIEEVEALDEISVAPAPVLRDSQPAIAPSDRKPPPPRRSARPSLPKAEKPRKKAWWETLFGDDFSRAYRPMTQRQLSREVDFILESLEIPRGAVILDLACGQGEICVELARRGYSVVGYDLSVYQLAMAGDNAQQARQKINFLQGDMREMAFDEMFDAVICWDTSFGYFEEDKNADVLSRVKKALKPGGRFVLDVMNRDFAAREAPYNHWFEGDGCVCMDDMSLDWITNRLNVKRSIILDDGRSKELHYSTRLYTLSEIGRMLHDVGFRVAKVSGDIVTKGAFFGPNSRRIIIQAGKP